MEHIARMHQEGPSSVQPLLSLETEMCSKEPSTQRVLEKDSTEKGKSSNSGQIKVFKIVQVKSKTQESNEVQLKEIVLPKNQVIILEVGTPAFASLKHAVNSESVVPLNKEPPYLKIAQVCHKRKAPCIVSVVKPTRNQQILESTSNGVPSVTIELQSDTPRIEADSGEMKTAPSENKDKQVESVSAFKVGAKKRKFDDDKVPHIRENKIIRLGMNRNPAVLRVPVRGDSLLKINHMQPIASGKAPQCSLLHPRFQAKANSDVSESILQCLRKSFPALSINGSCSKTASIPPPSRSLHYPTPSVKPYVVVHNHPASRKIRLERDLMTTQRAEERKTLHIFPDSPSLLDELTTQSNYIYPQTPSDLFDDSICAIPNPILNNGKKVVDECLTQFQFEAIDGQKFVFGQKFSAANDSVDDELTELFDIQQEEQEILASTNTTELRNPSSERRVDESAFFSESETSGFYDTYSSASSYSVVEPKMPSFRGKFFPKESVDVLWTWFNFHKTNPYPNREETKALAQNSGLSYEQVKGWFVNVRRRLTPGVISFRRKSVSHPQSFVLKQWLYNHKVNPYPDVNQTIALIKQTGLSYAQIQEWLSIARKMLTSINHAQQQQKKVI